MAVHASHDTERHTSRVEWVDRAKGIAILLVVLHHVIQFSADQGWAGDAATYVDSMLQTFRMPLFFAMSGLFFRRTATKSWRWLAVNRVLPFAYLYLIWTVVWHSWFDTMPVERDGLGLSYLFDHYDDPGVGPWYLYGLALYFIAAKALSPIPPWIQLAVAIVIAVPVAIRVVEVTWAWEYIAMYGPAFFAGMHGKALFIRLADRTTWVTVVSVAALWAGGTAVMYTMEPPFNRYLFLPLCGAGIALGVTLAAMLEGVDLLGWFGRRTLPIYLLHQPLIGALYAVDAIRSLPASAWIEATMLLCTWCVVVGASVAVWRLTAFIPGVYVAPWFGSGNATMTRTAQS